MALESRPYLTPSSSSVLAEMNVSSHVVSDGQLWESWSSGDDITIRARAALSDSFWSETGIEHHEEVWLIAVASCAPARSRWRAQARFRRSDAEWRADLDLVVDGSELAVELTAELWIVGPGRTGSRNPQLAIHPNAKLWQSPRPLVLRLERDGADFPTSAASFAASGRRATPWIVEVTTGAELEMSISSAVRLYVNTDLEGCVELAAGEAPADVYAAIECDIHLAVLHAVGRWCSDLGPGHVESIAEEDAGSLAALGVAIASRLGLGILEACRLAHEEPIMLISRSREAVMNYRKAPR